MAQTPTALFVVGLCAMAILASATSSCSAADGECAAESAGDSNSHMQLKQKIKVLEVKKHDVKKQAGMKPQALFHHGLLSRHQAHVTQALRRSYPKISPKEDQLKGQAQIRNFARMESLRAAGRATTRTGNVQPSGGNSPTIFPSDPSTPPAQAPADTTCDPPQNSCTMTYPGMEDHPQTWCQDGPCPLQCDWDTQTVCWAPPADDCGSGSNSSDDCFGTESCAPKSEGCPVECTDTQYKCREVFGDWTSNWCQDYPCPPQCTDEEHICYTPPPANCTDAQCNGLETCHPKSDPCPVHCADHEHICTMKDPMFPDHAPYQWCQDAPCPPICESDEMLCTEYPPNECWESPLMDESPTNPMCFYKDTCHRQSEGCPITCPEGDYKCREPPTCPTCFGWNHCSTEPCKPGCAEGEMKCYDYYAPMDWANCGDNCEQPSTCEPMTGKCPVTCYGDDHECVDEWGDYCMPKGQECYAGR